MRAAINDYGWRWKDISTSPDGRFLQGYSIVRDSSLDLDDKSEFLRPTYVYPRTIDDFEDEMRALADRKSIPDGWVSRTYLCKQWYRTNGLIIPANAEFTANVYSGGKTFLLASAVIKADKISVADGNAGMAAPPLAEEAYVRDYRYTRRNQSRMFPYAEYMVSGAWKSDSDPKLLAEANYQLNHGPKFGDYGLIAKLSSSDNRGRLIFIWLSLLLVSLVAITTLVRNKLKQLRQNT